MMKSANLYSNPSKAWVRENIRRFWILPLMEFLALFLIGILPILINYSHYQYILDYVNGSLMNNNYGIIAVFVICSIAMSVAVFSYIHGTASSTVAHSFPITRKRLFASSFWSGLVMLLIPVLIITIMYMMVSGAHLSADYDKSAFNPVEAAKVITLVHCLKWMVESSIIIAFVYAMSNLAAIIAGNRVIHVLLAMLINGLPFALLQLFRIYEQEFLFGYPHDGRFAISMLSPVSHAIRRSCYMGPSDIVPELVYVAVVILTTLISVWLYNKVQLERERSACVFPKISDIICVIVTFMGMTLLALSLSYQITTLDNGLIPKWIFILISIPSALVFYIICRMIADGTTRIFNMSSLKKFGIYLILAAVFFSFTVFDATGYQKRIPELSQISCVDIDSNYETLGTIRLTSEASIKNVISYHKAILSDHGGSSWNVNGNVDLVTLSYRLKNGNTLKRSYTVPSYKKDIATSRAYKAIFYSREYREKNIISYSPKMISRISLYNPEASGKQVYIYPEDYETFIAAFNKDIINETIIDRQTSHDIASVEIMLKGKYSTGEEAITPITITKSDKNVLRFLKADGYWAQYKKLNKDQ